MDAGDSANRKRLPDLQCLSTSMLGILGAGCWVWFPDVKAL